MPNCFTLTKKDEEEPQKLSEIDTELWILFEGAEPEGNKKWYQSWYDIIGLGLACGLTYNEIKSHISNPKTLAVANHLEEHYTSNAWYSPK